MKRKRKKYFIELSISKYYMQSAIYIRCSLIVFNFDNLFSWYFLCSRESENFGDSGKNQLKRQLGIKSHSYFEPYEGQKN